MYRRMHIRMSDRLEVAGRWGCLLVALLAGCQAAHPWAATLPADSRSEARERTHRHVADLTDQARAARHDGRSGYARKLLKEAVGLDPTDGHARHLLGLVYFEQGDLYNAAIHLDIASRLLSDRFEPCYNLGRVLEAGGQYEQAMRSYERALGRRLDHLETLENLARVRIKAGYQDQETLRLLDRCLDREKRPEWSVWLQQEVVRLRTRLGGEGSAMSFSQAANPDRHKSVAPPPASTE